MPNPSWKPTRPGSSISRTTMEYTSRGTIFSSSLLLLRYPPHQINLRVRHHVREARDAVRQPEERRDRRDVPDVFVAEAVRVQRREIIVADFIGAQAHLHREVEHRLLA